MRVLSNTINIRGVIFGVVVVCLFSVPAQAQPWDGNGVEGDPYLIYDACDMQQIGADANYWGAPFKLMADIDLSGYTGTSFNIIGYYLSGDNPFTGVFDGNGHTISNFTYTTTGTSFIGLFGVVRGPNAEIKDLGLINPNVDAGTGRQVGSLVGWLEDGTVANCYVQGGSVSGYRNVGGLGGSNSGTITNCYSSGSISGFSRVGGLVGWNNGTITNCYSTASVSGDYNVGGLVGTNIGSCLRVNVCIAGTISDCYAAGSVSGTGYVGGLVGSNGLSGLGNGLGTTSNSYATGNVSGDENVGGLVGQNYESTVSNCYSTGNVVGDSNVGGLVGLNDDGTVSASFWDKQTSGRSNMCGGQAGSASGCDDGNGKTTAEMQDINTFLAAGWDFVGEYTNGPSDDWAEPEAQGYMILWWQLDPLPPLPTFSGGTGEPDDPYLISTAVQLNRIGHNYRLMERHFALISDIDLAGVDFFFIGSQGYPYSGVFDGNGHTISNFTYSSTGTPYIGLFGYVRGTHVEIKDLGLINPNVDGGSGNFVGGLVGDIYQGSISNCYVEGGSVSGGDNVGGLVGLSFEGIVSNSHTSACSISASSNVGGLVGYNSGTINNCQSTGSVSGTGNIGGLVGHNEGTMRNSYFTGSVWGGDFVGGLVGDNLGGSTITNCYSTGSVSGNDYVGGLVGSGGTINDCYSTGSVSGTGDYIGGLVGKGGSATNCYATGSVSGIGYVGGLVGESGTISNCYSTGSVFGGEKVGGLVGENTNGATVTNCYATGRVDGGLDVGGLVGFNYGDIADCYSRGEVTGVLDVGGLVGENGYYSDIWATYWGTVTNCYSAGPISGAAYVGGLLGNNDGEVAGSFWDVNTTGPSNMCGRVGAHGSGCNDSNGLPTPQMQTESTFTSAGWDFVGESANGTDDFWDICEGTNYPRLAWQIPIAGDFNCPDGVDGIDLGLLCEQWLFEELSADVWPDGGDGFVNFFDWAIFADGWQITKDIYDLADFAEQWLGRVLSADVWPGGGDNFVDFSDWAVFADAWQSTPESPNWNRRCDIAPAGGDEIVDMDDIVVFMQQWLTAGSYYRHLDADIAPTRDGDGIVNMLDFAALANNWLQ